MTDTHAGASTILLPVGGGGEGGTAGLMRAGLCSLEQSLDEVFCLCAARKHLASPINLATLLVADCVWGGGE